jgi:hypothetical protein
LTSFSPGTRIGFSARPSAATIPGSLPLPPTAPRGYGTPPQARRWLRCVDIRAQWPLRLSVRRLAHRHRIRRPYRAHLAPRSAGSDARGSASKLHLPRTSDRRSIVHRARDGGADAARPRRSAPTLRSPWTVQPLLLPAVSSARRRGAPASIFKLIESIAGAHELRPAWTLPTPPAAGEPSIRWACRPGQGACTVGCAPSNPACFWPFRRTA